MFKKWASLILIFVVVLSTAFVFADAKNAPDTYTITVTEDGGKYQLGNIELNFKKDSMEKGMEPVTFTVQLYAENGIPYIDIEPSVEQFAKDVKVKVEKGEVEMYDIATNTTVNVELENYSFKVEHFSRYILVD
ncbi:MAG: hypothetical protein K0R84_903 [Clostridia bacterium]|jgi:ribosomal protein L21E|nr:hypothetical protein [Clostridia bacterium]